MFRTLETFLVKAAENLSNKIFCLGLVRQEKACRPGPHLKAAAKGGPAWPLRNTGFAKPRVLSTLYNHRLKSRLKQTMRENSLLASVQALIDLNHQRIDGLSWGYYIGFLGLTTP